MRRASTSRTPHFPQSEASPPNPPNVNTPQNPQLTIKVLMRPNCLRSNARRSNGCDQIVTTNCRAIFYTCRVGDQEFFREAGPPVPRCLRRWSVTVHTLTFVIPISYSVDTIAHFLQSMWSLRVIKLYSTSLLSLLYFSKSEH